MDMFMVGRSYDDNAAVPVPTFDQYPGNIPVATLVEAQGCLDVITQRGDSGYKIYSVQIVEVGLPVESGR